MRVWTHTALALAMLVGASSSLALGTISDGAVAFSYVTFNDGSVGYSSETDFTGAGSGDQTYESWWFYRVGGDTQQSGLLAPDSESYVGDLATLGWSDVDARGLFDAVLQVGILDGGGGSGNLLQRLTVTNTSGASLGLDVFHLTDFDVSGTFDDDSAVLAGSGTDIQITVSDGSTADTIQFIGYGATDFQVTAYPILIDGLTLPSLMDLDNTGLPFTTADFSGAFQWSSVSIAAGESMSFMSQFAVNTSLAPPGTMPIPEPRTGALLGIGLIALALLRERRS
jgi:hypothetical protein